MFKIFSRLAKIGFILVGLLLPAGLSFTLLSLLPPVLAQVQPGQSPLSGAKGGTGNAFMSFTGPATTPRTYTLPNQDDTIATLGFPQTWSAPQTFSIVNAVTGYQVNGGATSGYFLRGNGTNFVGSAILATDLPIIPLTKGGLGSDQSAATAGQAPIFPGSGAAAVPTTISVDVATEAALVALAPGQYVSVYLQGYYANSDGGEGVFIWNGSSTATPDGGVVIQPSAGGTGRWIRSTYTNQPNVVWWGAKCNSNGSTGTDDSAAFNAASAWATSVQGAHIGIPHGLKCAIASPVSINSGGVFFEGLGAATTIQSVGAQFGQCSATVVWTGSANLAMFTWTPPTSGSTIQGIHGGGLHSICLSGQNVAGYGYIIVSARDMIFNTVYLSNFTQWAAYYTVFPVVNSNAQLGETCDTQQNLTENVVIDQYAATGGLMLLDGWFGPGGTTPAPSCNVSANTFINITTGQVNGTGIVERGTDDNTWITILQYVALTGGAPYGFDWSCPVSGSAASTAACSNNDYMYGVTLGKSIARGTTSFATNIPAVQNTIYGLDKGQSPDPVLETGAQVAWITSSGIIHNFNSLSLFQAPGSGPSIDISPQAPLTIANGSSQPISCGNYIQLSVAETLATGSFATYGCGNNVCALNTAAGTWIAPTTSPSGGHISVDYDGSAGYRVYNNVGSQAVAYVQCTKLH